MPRLRRLTLFLSDTIRARRDSGGLNFLLRVEEALTKAGVEVVTRLRESYGLADAEGWTLHHMTAPPDPMALVFRQVYLPPFWQIETTPERWRWRVASTRFDPDTVDPQVARIWADGWRRRLHGPRFGAVSRDGYLLAPLQGRLTERRSFQAMSPLAMLETAARSLPGRPIIATLHPGERYTGAERRALDNLVRRVPQLSLAETGSDALLGRCDGVLTQNSSTALQGLFLRKPALLFAGIDFHHAVPSVPRDGLEAAFDAFRSAGETDFDRYLHWFFQTESINAGRDDVGTRILQSFAACGAVV